MSAVILAFPRRSSIQALVRAGDGSAPFTPAWCAQHLPLVVRDLSWQRGCLAHFVVNHGVAVVTRLNN